MTNTPYGFTSKASGRRSPIAFSLLARKSRNVPQGASAAEAVLTPIREVGVVCQGQPTTLTPTTEASHSGSMAQQDLIVPMNTLPQGIMKLHWVQDMLNNGFAPVLTTGAMLSQSSNLPSDHMVSAL